MDCNAITIIPEGCLKEKIITLHCKSPEETLTYGFTIVSRMMPTDYITDVSGQPSKDSGVIIHDVVKDAQTFSCKITGGRLNHDVGIRFIVYTREKNILEFTVKLPIRSNGILYNNGIFSTVLDAASPAGSQGPQGERGEKGDDGKQGERGEKGDDGKQGERGEKGDDGKQGERGEKGDDGKQGERGEKGDDGKQGERGESYINNGTVNLDVESLQLADIQSVNIADISEHSILLDNNKNQLVIKQNNQWVPLNMANNNFGIETTYKNNTGTFAINFAPSAFVMSSNAVSGASGLTSGYLSPDTSKPLPTPTTLLIRVDFKISSTDTTDADYYVVGYENSYNIRINPGKKTVSFYNAQTKSYSIDYTALGINLHDDKFHTAYFILNNGYQGHTCFAIDGVFFNKTVPAGKLYLTNLRVRGDSNNTVSADVLTVKNVGISSKLPSLLNLQSVPTDFTEFEGYYTLLSNSVENKQLSQGILLKPYSNLDSLNTIIPMYLNSTTNDMAAFGADGLYRGTGLITTTAVLDIFTFECYFKYNSTYDTTITARRSIIGKFGLFSVGITANSNAKLTFKNYTTNVETTLVDAIEKDEWHTLAMVCKDRVASIFIDGEKLLTVLFDFSWDYIFFRGMGYGDYVPLENTIVIKNISMTVGQAKYYNNYDKTLTPAVPNSDGFFYPLVDGVISNQNTVYPLVQISMNNGDSFSIWTVPNDGTPAMYANLIPTEHDYDHPPSLQNTKGSRVFVKDISGNPIKGSI